MNHCVVHLGSIPIIPLQSPNVHVVGTVVVEGAHLNCGKADEYQEKENSQLSNRQTAFVSHLVILIAQPEHSSRI